MPVVYENFAAFSKWVHIATGFSMVLQNLFESFGKYRDAPRIVDLQLGAPTPTKLLDFRQFSTILPDFASYKANTGVRWAHITTRIETSEKSSPTHE